MLVGCRALCPGKVAAAVVAAVWTAAAVGPAGPESVAWEMFVAPPAMSLAFITKLSREAFSQGAVSGQVGQKGAHVTSEKREG